MLAHAYTLRWNIHVTILGERKSRGVLRRVVLRSGETSRHESSPQTGVVTDSAHGRSQRGAVTRRGQHRVDVVSDDLAGPSDPPRSLRLGRRHVDHNLAEGLGRERAVHEQVDLRKLGLDVLSKAAALYAVADPEPPRLGSTTDLAPRST